MLLMLLLGEMTREIVSEPECPVTISLCECLTKYTRYYYIYCDNIGQWDNVPRFTEAPSTVFEELSIRYESSVKVIQVGEIF